MKTRLLTLTAAMGLSSVAWAASADLGSQVVAGKQIFETTCAASTCHGSGGVGAGGPKLVDRNFSLDLVRTTVLNGRSGTPMPAFKELFDSDMTASVIAYVLSISTGGRWATAVPVAAADKPTAAAPWPESIAIGAGQGHPAAGYALFYDAAKPTSCRTCHSYRENGGPVGPDFAALHKSPSEIFELISKPGAANPQFPAVTLTTRANARHSGIKRTETDESIRIVDVSVLPPVTRTFLKADVASVEPLKAEGFFYHSALSYTQQNLLDAAAFLAPLSK